MRLNIELPDDLHTQLKTKCAEDKCTMSALIRRFLQKELNMNARMPLFTAGVPSKPTTTSEALQRAKEILTNRSGGRPDGN